jgi:hypothetical protein
MQQYPIQRPMPPIPGNGKATASLVLGICAILFSALLFGIIGIVLAKQSKREAARYGLYNNMATAGFVLSIIGTIYGALVTVFVIIYIIFSVWMIGYAAFFDSYDSWMRLLVFL